MIIRESMQKWNVNGWLYLDFSQDVLPHICINLRCYRFEKMTEKLNTFDFPQNVGNLARRFSLHCFVFPFLKGNSEQNKQSVCGDLIPNPAEFVI